MPVMRPEPEQPTDSFLCAAKLPPLCFHCGRGWWQWLLCHCPLKVTVSVFLACRFFFCARSTVWSLLCIQPKIIQPKIIELKSILIKISVCMLLVLRLCLALLLGGGTGWRGLAFSGLRLMVLCASAPSRWISHRCF